MFSLEVMLDYNSSLSKEKLKFSYVNNLGDVCSIRIIHYVKEFIYKGLKDTLFCISYRYRYAYR